MIAACGASNPGCVRSNNEDSYLIDPLLGLYIVADGMGGAQAGEQASKLAVDTVKSYISEAGHVDPEVLVAAFEKANERVMAMAQSDSALKGMGTTLTAVAESSDALLVANVGDSRAYIADEAEFRAITDDQTWVNEIGRRLGIQEENLKTHPMRHVLTMAIGVSSPLRVNTYQVDPRPGVQILLCSDGLHGVVDPGFIEQTLRSDQTAEQKCDALIEAARSAGGPDNITAVLLQAVPNGS